MWKTPSFFVISSESLGVSSPCSRMGALQLYVLSKLRDVSSDDAMRRAFSVKLQRVPISWFHTRRAVASSQTGTHVHTRPFTCTHIRPHTHTHTHTDTHAGPSPVTLVPLTAGHTHFVTHKVSHTHTHTRSRERQRDGQRDRKTERQANERAHYDQLILHKQSCGKQPTHTHTHTHTHTYTHIHTHRHKHTHTHTHTDWDLELRTLSQPGLLCCRGKNQKIFTVVATRFCRYSYQKLVCCKLCKVKIWGTLLTSFASACKSIKSLEARFHRAIIHRV